MWTAPIFCGVCFLFLFFQICVGVQRIWSPSAFQGEVSLTGKLHNVTQPTNRSDRSAMWDSWHHMTRYFWDDAIGTRTSSQWTQPQKSYALYDSTHAVWESSLVEGLIVYSATYAVMFFGVLLLWMKRCCLCLVFQAYYKRKASEFANRDDAKRQKEEDARKVRLLMLRSFCLVSWKSWSMCIFNRTTCIWKRYWFQPRRELSSWQVLWKLVLDCCGLGDIKHDEFRSLC